MDDLRSIVREIANIRPWQIFDWRSLRCTFCFAEKKLSADAEVSVSDTDHGEDCLWMRAHRALSAPPSPGPWVMTFSGSDEEWREYSGTMRTIGHPAFQSADEVVFTVEADAPPVRLPILLHWSVNDTAVGSVGEKVRPKTRK